MYKIYVALRAKSNLKTNFAKLPLGQGVKGPKFQDNSHYFLTKEIINNNYLFFSYPHDLNLLFIAHALPSISNNSVTPKAALSYSWILCQRVSVNLIKSIYL